MSRVRALWCVCITALVSVFPLDALSLKERFDRAKEGDFVVTHQWGHYSLLSIHTLSTTVLVLEEIAVPDSQVDLKTVDWQAWVSQKAPGHTAWVFYEIDRKEGSLLRCFSIAKNGWVKIDASEQLFSRLLNLSLKPIPHTERKKIGTPPAPSEQDHRAEWVPPFTVKGKKQPKVPIEALKGRWPDDHSPLALATVELYFATDLPSFPFPIWVEAQTAHYAVKIRGVDRGHQLISPYKAQCAALLASPRSQFSANQ